MANTLLENDERRKVAKVGNILANKIFHCSFVLAGLSGLKDWHQKVVVFRYFRKFNQYFCRYYCCLIFARRSQQQDEGAARSITVL